MRFVIAFFIMMLVAAPVQAFDATGNYGTVGVERIFPLNMPALNKIEVNKKGKVRQSRIYYFRDLRGKKARIKEV